MIQLTLDFDLPEMMTERPPCTCNCGLCRGECSCEGCAWDFDGESFQPTFTCCSVCGEVIGIEYADSVSFPIAGNCRAKCCAADFERVFAKGTK